MTVHIQVTSDSDNGRVKKLSYQAKQHFIITKVLEQNSFEVRKYNNPTSAPRKYKPTELYFLPSYLFPSKN